MSGTCCGERFSATSTGIGAGGGYASTAVNRASGKDSGPEPVAAGTNVETGCSCRGGDSWIVRVFGFAGAAVDWFCRRRPSGAELCVGNGGWESGAEFGCYENAATD